MTTLGIHHLGLSVADLEQTSRFFTECLGWTVAREVPEYPARFVTNGSAFFTLWQAGREAAPFDRRKNVGMHHVALATADEAHLRELFARIEKWPGVRVEFAPEPVGNGPATHCMFFEPGGIRMELFCPG